MSIRRRSEFDGEPVATETISGEHYQKVIVTDSTGGAIAGPIAATQDATDTVTASEELVAANASRKGGYIHFPVSNTDSVYVSLNNPAASTDMEHLPGSNFFLTLGFGGPAITNAVYGVAKSGTQSYIVVQG